MKNYTSYLFIISAALMAFAMLCVFLIAFFMVVASPIIINGNAMAPNLKDHQYWITNKISYSQTEPQRYDIVEYISPVNHLPTVGRIIGVPNDTLSLRSTTYDFTGQLQEKYKVYINDETEDDTYLPKDTYTPAGPLFHPKESLRLTKGEYIILGDNRAHSSDSRFFGVVDRSQIKSKLWFCYWNCFE